MLWRISCRSRRCGALWTRALELGWHSSNACLGLRKPTGPGLTRDISYIASDTESDTLLSWQPEKLGQPGHARGLETSSRSGSNSGRETDLRLFCRFCLC